MTDGRARIVIVKTSYWEAMYLYDKLHTEKAHLDLYEVLRSLSGIRIGKVIYVHLNEDWIGYRSFPATLSKEDLPRTAIDYASSDLDS